MPAAIVAVAAGAAATAATGLAVGAGLVVAGGIGASIIGAVASTVVGSVLSSALTPSQQQTAVQAATGIQVNAESQSAPLYTVYGETRIGGTVQVVGASGTNNEYLHLIIAHCEGEVDSASMLYLGDLPYTDSKFSGLVHWEFFNGTDNQAACTTLAGVNGWDAAHRLRGVAYSYVRLTYKQESFNGIPQITVKLKGRRVYDPRNGTTAWSANPALCLRDYLINARFGRGIPASLIDDASIISAANTCDSTYTDTDGGSRKLHTCNGVTNPDTSTLENVRGMMTTCRGRLVYSARGYSLIVDKARASTFAFTPDNIVGAWSISLPGKRTMRNKVVGAWVNPADLYKEDLYPAESTAFRALDNGVMLESRIELPFTQNTHEAQMLCERELRQSRIGIQVSFRAFMSALKCEVGDVVTITHPTPGWTAKPFDVTRITLLSDDEVQVECREYDSVIYDPHVLTAPRTTYTTLLPDPRQVPAFDTLGITSGTDTLQRMSDGTIVSRMLLSWSPPTNMYLDAGQVEVQYSEAGSGYWHSTYHDPMIGRAYISPAKDGAWYIVKVRWVNEFGVTGEWQQVEHQVVGKTAPPSDVAVFTANAISDRIVLSWDSIPDADLSEYEIRQGNDWLTGVLIGRTKSTTFKALANFAGSRQWWIAAIDTSGNYSLLPTSASIDIQPAAAPTVAMQVIDNNVLLRWTDVSGTLGTATYEIRRGADYATSEPIGNKSGLFTTILETVSGTYRYWVAAIDTAGNIGAAGYAEGQVNQPPDYVLQSDQASTFSGTKVNAYIDDGSLLLPVNTTETWAQHFTSRSWTNIQAQINAGYPIYAQPAESSGSYTEVIDYGANLQSFRVQASYDVTQISAAVSVVCTLYTSLNGTTWGTGVVGTQAYFGSFRYLKIVLTATPSVAGTSLAAISNLRIKLDAKRKTWGGSVACAAGDSGGTIAYLTDTGLSTGNKLFTDVLAITLTPAGKTTSQTALLNFVDAPNPLSFQALLFNSAGTRISGTVYYNVIGV